LYSYSTGYIKYYFFEDEKSRLTAITKQPDTEFYDDTENKRLIKEDVKYKGILNYVFRESPDLTNEIIKADFNDNSLIDITKKYHDKVCKTGEECIIFEGKPDNKYTRFKFSAYGGYLTSNYKKHQYKFDKLSSPVFGVIVNFSIPRWMKSLSIYADLSLFKLKDEFKTYYGTAYYTSELEATIFETKFGGRYTYHKGVIRPFIQGGLSVDFVSQPTPTTKSIIMDGLLYGFNAGAGLQFEIGHAHSVFFLAEYNRVRETGALYRLSSFQFKLGFTY